jgi:hypothetical protein
MEKWKIHINYLLNKLGVVMRKLVHILNIEALKSIFCSFSLSDKILNTIVMQFNNNT